MLSSLRFSPTLFPVFFENIKPDRPWLWSNVCFSYVKIPLNKQHRTEWPVYMLSLTQITLSYVTTRRTLRTEVRHSYCHHTPVLAPMLLLVTATDG